MSGGLVEFAGVGQFDGLSLSVETNIKIVALRSLERPHFIVRSLSYQGGHVRLWQGGNSYEVGVAEGFMEGP